MDTSKLAKEIQRAIESLRSEQEEIDAKIAAMEDALKTLGEQSVRSRRGRPRKTATATSAGRSRKKPHWSPEARKAAAERMRKYWEDRKTTGKKAGKKKTKKKATKKRVAKKAAAAAAE